MCYNIVQVYWRDIEGIHDWSTRQEAIEAGRASYEAQHVSVGYILYENNDYILLAATWTPDLSMFNDVSMIMKSVIVDIDILSNEKCNEV